MALLKRAAALYDDLAHFQNHPASKYMICLPIVTLIVLGLTVAASLTPGHSLLKNGSTNGHDLNH